MNIDAYPPETLFPIDRYSTYRAYCLKKQYCQPFVPYVGPNYHDSESKFAYVGGGARWDGQEQKLPEIDVEALHQTDLRHQKFIDDGMTTGGFWTLFRRVGAEVYGDSSQYGTAFARKSMWTNLSKTGVVGESAPPDSDKDLRVMDVGLHLHELKIAKPKFILCVSGSLCEKTGIACYDDWPKRGGYLPSVQQSSVRNTPWGGTLYWTMHPNRKPKAWFDAIIADLKILVGER